MEEEKVEKAQLAGETTVVPQEPAGRVRIKSKNKVIRKRKSKKEKENPPLKCNSPCG